MATNKCCLQNLNLNTNLILLVYMHDSYKRYKYKNESREKLDEIPFKFQNLKRNENVYI